MTTDFEALARITGVLQERSLRKYREVLMEEDQLKRELAEIDHLRLSATAEDAWAHARKISGLDAQWQAWLIQRRTRINQQLALLQVRKEERQEGARLSFGRNRVTSELADNAHHAKRQARVDREEETLRALVLLQKSHCGSRD